MCKRFFLDQFDVTAGNIQWVVGQGHSSVDSMSSFHENRLGLLVDHPNVPFHFLFFFLKTQPVYCYGSIDFKHKLPSVDLVSENNTIKLLMSRLFWKSMCNQSINIHQTHRCHHHCYHHHRMGFSAAETSTLYRETVVGVVIVAAILTVATTVSNNQSMSSGGGSSSGVK